MGVNNDGAELDSKYPNVMEPETIEIVLGVDPTLKQSTINKDTTGNWSPLTQALVFAKKLEPLVTGPMTVRTKAAAQTLKIPTVNTA